MPFESDRNVLAVTLDPTLDRDRDGWADANNDKDYLDVNNNGSRDAGEPERIDEDLLSDNDNDNAPGIIGIDDNGDGIADNSSASSPNHDNDEDGVQAEDSLNGIDDDNDGSIDEDIRRDMNVDGAPGVKGFDDDFDGTVDEGSIIYDDDEDGLANEDWLDPVVYFLNGSTLMQRIPNINPIDGTDYQQSPIADDVSLFRVIRIPQASGSVLVDISLQISPLNGDPVNFNTRVAVGSGL